MMKTQLCGNNPQSRNKAGAGEKFTYDSEAGKSQVLKWPCFAHSVQKRVQEKRDVSSKKS